MQNNDIVDINPNNINFHPILKDIENIFWLFLLSHSTLSNPDVQNIIKTMCDKLFIPLLEKYNEWVDLRIKIKGNKYMSSSKILEHMICTGKTISILAFDYLASSKYDAIINKDIKYQFLRHIRNGAAHHNIFNLKDIDGNWKIEDGDKIEWNNKIIDKSLQGKKVFNEFITMNDVFLLIKELSEQITEIDKLNK